MTPGRLRWLALVAGAGTAAAALSSIGHALPPPTSSDIDQLWLAARALAEGRSPYQAVLEAHRGSVLGYPLYYSLYYPLPAVLLLLPLAPFSFEVARAVWAGVGAAAFMAAALRHRRGLLPALLSASLLNAIAQGQWSPLLVASAVLPWLGFTWAAKPTVGASLFAAYPSRAAAWGAGAMVLVSFLAWPSWLGEWIDALRHTDHLRPLVVRPGGALLLLALLRWREPEARLLVALACVPQTAGLYESLPLFLIPREKSEGYLLAALSFLPALVPATIHPGLASAPLESAIEATWPWLFLSLYLPALVMVLRKRNPKEPE
jgi:hypothetical protein